MVDPLKIHRPLTQAPHQQTVGMSHQPADRSAGATRCIHVNPFHTATDNACASEPRNSSVSELRPLRRQELGQADLSGFACHNYRLGKRLGCGGMGVVYQAQHTVLGKTFAMKFVAKEASDHSESTKRFVQELTAIGKLNHPHIVSATDAGEVDGVPYYVTELLDGHDLVHWIATHGPADIGTACEMIRQSALGLGHAHRHGFLHRDIKPSNLFFETRGNIKLLDFGLVRSQQESSELTGSGQMMGTVDYFSPEQAEDCRHCTPASDIYSLGATMIYLLSGEPPYPDHQYPTIVSKLRGHMIDRPQWLVQHASDLPHKLVALLDSMLAKSPQKRPQSCEAVAEQLVTWAKPLGSDAKLTSASPPSIRITNHTTSRALNKKLAYRVFSGVAATGLLAIGIHALPLAGSNNEQTAAGTIADVSQVSLDASRASVSGTSSAFEETTEVNSLPTVSSPEPTQASSREATMNQEPAVDSTQEPPAITVSVPQQATRSARALQLDTSISTESSNDLGTITRSAQD